MKSGLLTTIATICIATAGCAAPPTQRTVQTWTPISFDQSEYDALPKQGTGVVRGQVFATTVAGEVKRGAGRNVLLMPATSYRKQWYENTIVNRKPPAVSADVRYRSYDKQTIADADGKFEFLGVPPGEYIVLSDIDWQTAEDVRQSAHYGARIVQGGLVARKVIVKDGATTHTMLSR